MQGNIRRRRLGPLGPREAGVNRKETVNWQKRAGVAEGEKYNYEEEYIERFEARKKEKEIHCSLLFVTQGNEKKVRIKK